MFWSINTGITHGGKLQDLFRLCRHSIYGKDASRIVARWKEIARRNGIMPVKQEDPTSSEDEQKPERYLISIVIDSCCFTHFIHFYNIK